ncbi:dihydrofolate reductase [Rouxiella sp. T17]|uniref:dihydrofolate reductase n=1 Tax=Rouxiella sp. T17 TaxID=3085684 RepID=UPI002FCBE644
MLISMVYVISQDGTLGHNQSIPWKTKIEFNRYKAVIFNKTLIVGRKSWESLSFGKNTKDIVVISSMPLADSNVQWAASLEAALEMARLQSRDEVVIVGGASLFKEAMNYCHVIYKATILMDIPGNVRAPVIPPDRFKLIWVRNIKELPAFTFQTFVIRELENKKPTTDFGLIRV